MTHDMTVATRRGDVGWSFDTPVDLKVLERAAPALGYPWEVAGIFDWDFRPECEDRPRLDLMPPDGVFVWLVMGDLQLDYEVEPHSGPPFLPYQYVLPADVPSTNGDSSTATRVAPLATDDREETGSPSVLSWARLVFLTEPDGTTTDEPLYLMLRVFAGQERSSIVSVNALISSLSYSYAD